MHRRTAVGTRAIILATIVATASAAYALVDDFQVSNRTDGHNLTRPLISMSADGSYIVSWLETSSIHARRFTADGTPRGGEFIVNSSPVMGTHYAAAISDSGLSAFVWIEGSTSRRVVYRRYNRDGSSFDPYGRQLNSEGGSRNLRDPDCAVTNDGLLYAAWATDILGKPTKAAVVAAVANPTPAITHVDSLYGKPQIAAGSGGRCVVVGTKGSFALTGVLLSFASSPTIIKPHFALGSGAAVGTFDVAMRSNGEWVAAWEAHEGMMMNVKLQRFTAAGVAIGQPFYAEHDHNGSADKQPRICYGPKGQIAAVWTDPLENSVRYRSFSAAAVASSPTPTEVLDGLGGQAGSADVAINGLGVGRVVWNDDRLSSYDVYLQPLTASAAIMGTVLRIDALGSSAAYPAVAASREEDLAVSVWQRTGDIVAQFFGANASYVGANRIVNQNSAGSRPTAAVNDSSVLVVWQDSADVGGPKTYGRTFRGATAGGSAKPLSNPGTIARMPAATATGTGYLVAWEHTTASYDTATIRGQFLAAAGSELGQNFTISTHEGIHCAAPAAGGNKTGLTAVVWHTDASFVLSGPFPLPIRKTEVFLRLYDASRTALTDAVKVNGTGVTGSDASVAVDESGRTAVVWLDSGGQRLASHVYCRFFSPTGVPIDSSFRVDTDSSSCRRASCAISSEGALVVVWQQTTTNNILSRTINIDRVFQTGQIRHNNDSVGFQLAVPRVAVGTSGTMIVWTNALAGDITQRDIWGELSDVHYVTRAATPVPMGSTHALAPATRSPFRYNLLGRRIPLRTTPSTPLPSGVYVTPESGAVRSAPMSERP